MEPVTTIVSPGSPAVQLAASGNTVSTVEQCTRAGQEDGISAAS